MSLRKKSLTYHSIRRYYMYIIPIMPRGKTITQLVPVLYYIDGPIAEGPKQRDFEGGTRLMGL